MRKREIEIVTTTTTTTTTKLNKTKAGNRKNVWEIDFESGNSNKVINNNTIEHRTQNTEQQLRNKKGNVKAHDYQLSWP